MATTDEDQELENIITDIPMNELTKLQSILSDEKQDTYTNDMTMTWSHILHAIKQELYNAVSNTIHKIITDTSNEIKMNDLSDDTCNKVLNILTDKKKAMSQEEYFYIKDLIQKAKHFQPHTECMSIYSHNTI